MSDSTFRACARERGLTDNAPAGEICNHCDRVVTISDLWRNRCMCGNALSENDATRLDPDWHAPAAAWNPAGEVQP